MSIRPTLTDEVEDRILMWVRSGAFPEVAAEAEGVPAEVFARWMAWGSRTQPPPRPRYRRFVRNVRQAAAQARLRSEIKVREKDLKFWLLSGPGKERPGCPGWTTAVKGLPPRDEAALNLFADPALAGLLETLLAALAPFPEARRAAVEALRAAEPSP